MRSTRPVAVSIHATSPAFIGPPVTDCGCGRNRAPAMLTAATSRKGSAENSRIRSVLRRTIAKVMPRALRCELMLPDMCQTCMKISTQRRRIRRFRPIDRASVHVLHVSIGTLSSKLPGNSVWYDRRMSTVNSFGTRTALAFGGRTVQTYSLPSLERAGFADVARLPYSMKILLENLLRHEDGRFVKAADVEALARWDLKSTAQKEISFAPARVLLQDFTGVPAVVDLAAMRDGIARLGGDPNKVNPLQPVEPVIDHSVQVDYFGQANAFQLNAELEFTRNKERYAFLRWGQDAFDNFRVVPPDTGIVHQVNLEYLARVIMAADSPDGPVCFPDTLVGTDSHTTMVNGLGVMGWGVGGIEAEAAMLGQPISMLIPQVLGFRLVGTMLEGATATDLVLTITEKLRKHGVVRKFVEFFGSGLEHLTIADRATLGNMCPEYGATIAIFPIDEMTLDYLKLTGREPEQVALVEAYSRAQGMFRTPGDPDPVYTETIELDLSTVEPCLAGPKRPQDRVSLKQAKSGFQAGLGSMMASSSKKGAEAAGSSHVSATTGGGSAVLTAPPSTQTLEHGAVVIAAITSCTNTSNPSVMIGAGL